MNQPPTSIMACMTVLIHISSRNDAWRAISMLSKHADVSVFSVAISAQVCLGVVDPFQCAFKKWKLPMCSEPHHV